MTLSRRVALPAVAALLFPLFASAGTSEVRVLFDVDNNAATGCAVGGMSGVEQVLVTQIGDNDTTASVTSTLRLACSGGVLGTPIDINTTGWPAGWSSSSGQMLAETRLPFSALGSSLMPHDMRVGFDGTRGTASFSVLTKANGDPILFPTPSRRRRAVGFPGEDRVIVLDGHGDDWGMISALTQGSAGGGASAIKLIKAFGFANPLDSFVYFRFDLNLSALGLLAVDDFYTRIQGQSFTQAAPGVLANDEPSSLPLTATAVTDPGDGSVTLNPDGSFTYTPYHPFGITTDSFQYKAAAGSDQSNVATVRIKVQIVNQKPKVVDATFSVNENMPNGTVVGTVLVNDPDSGDEHTFTFVSGNTGGAFAINANTGVITVANASAINFENDPQYDLVVKATDDGTPQYSDNGDITVNINNTNDVPVAVADSNTVAEDGSVNVAAPGVLANDTDQDVPHTLTAVLDAAPTNAASFALNTDGSYNYAPNPNYNGGDSFTYHAMDNAAANSNTVTVSLTVTAVNDAPSFTAGPNQTINEDAGLQTVNGWAASSPGPANESAQNVTYVIDSNDNAALFSTLPSVAPNGTLTYTPAANANGAANITLHVVDDGPAPGVNASATQSFTITVNAVNDPPTFNLQANHTSNEDAGGQTVAGFASSISVGPANESGQTITSFNLTNDTPGLFLVQPAIAPNGTLTYTTNANAFGTANLTATATDSAGATSAPAQSFTIVISPVNDEPTFTIGGNPPPSNEDAGPQTISGFATAITTGPGDGPQTLTFTVTPTGATGTLAFSAAPAIDASGNLTYTASADTNGTATFNVVLTDNGSNTPPNDNTSGTQSFTITVTAVNDPPTFNLQANHTVDEDAGGQTVAGFASSISVGPADESAQTITSFNLTNDNSGLFLVQPAIAPNGSLTYTPAANAFGTANLTATATDSAGATSAPAQPFTIVVNAINDEPTFNIAGDPAASNEDAGLQTVNGFAGTVSAGPNEGSQIVTFNLTPNGTTGGLTFSDAPAIDASGNLTYTATANANGTATFNVVLTDNGASAPPPNDNTSNTQSFTITVTAVNDPPSFVLGANQSVNEDPGLQTVNGFASSISVGPPNEIAQTITSFNVSNDNNGLFSSQPAIDTAGNLTYTPALNAFGSATVSVTATDSGGATSSPAQTFTITVNPINDAPVVVAGGTLNYTENQAATAIDTGLTIADVDSPNMTSATIQLTTNYVNGQDVLSFVNTVNITGNFVAGTGTLTLTGSDTRANYETALRSVRYNNTSDNPSTLARTVVWQVNDGAGVNNLSNTPTSTINVAATNDAPAVDAAANFGYTEGTGAQVIDNTLTITDPDDTQMSGATVQITANYVNGEDILAFVNAFGITGNFVAASGTLTLSGTTTIANYESALHTVTYQNTSTNPSIAPRTVTWTVSDVALAPGSDTTTINITPVNSAPVLTAGGTLNYNENDPATNVDTTVTVVDADTPNLASATVTLTSNYQNGQDVLSFATMFGIVGNFVPATGTLTLTGSTTPTNWQTALQTVKYNNTSDNPSTLARTVQWQIDDGEAVSNLSNTPTSTINVAALNDPPTVNAGGPLTYTEGDGAVVIDNTVTAADLDDATLPSASVQITGNYVNGEDVLAFTNAFGITGNFVAATGTLNLTGPASPANFQNALRTITYQNSSENPSGLARTLTWTVNDAASSGTDTSTINVTPVNDAPVLSVTGALLYTENDPATNVLTSANITDADDTNIDLATIVITGNYVNGEDVLSYVTALGITGNFVPASGTLTLTGSATLANYITALQNVKYVNTSNFPSTAARTLTWTVNDGTSNSTTSPTSSITITSVNDPPVNTLPAGSLSTNEDIDLTGLVFSIADPDIGSNDLDVQLVVTNGVITLNSVAGMSNIIAGDGTLDAFIHFQGPLAAWNNALNGVTFRPNTNFNGTASIQIITSDQGFTGIGGTLVDNDTKNITVNAVNDAPVLTVAASPIPTYTENGAPINIATSASITDVDDTNMESATVQITGNYENGPDVLAYVTALGITGNFVPATGTLTLTGTSSLANYITALQNVRYASTSENPSALQRTVTWIVNDGSVNSNSQTTNINIVNVNDPPAINASDLAYTEDAGAVTIDATLTASDIDDDPLPSATVQITANYVNGQDILAFTNAFGITGNFVAASGTLMLTGPASPANFQSALRTVTYQNTSNTPSTATRSVVWTLNDDEPSSGTDTTSITVTATNDPPVLTLSGTLNYTEGDAATSLIASATITDADDTNIESASVQITGNYANGQDVLSYVTALGIVGNFVPATGTLNLTGSATLANYQTALANVKYANTSEAPSTLARTATWVVNDGDINSNNQTSTINVTAINDPPVNNLPTNVQSVNEDTALNFTGAGNTVSVTDPDALAGNISVQIVTTNGTTTIVTPTGITFAPPAGNGTASYTITGTLGNVNTSLGTLRFNPTLNFPGAAASGIATITLNTTDNGNTPAPAQADNGDVFNITVNQVNDPPTAGNDAQDTIGNTELVVNASPTSTTPFVGVTSATGVTSNDSDPVEGNAFTVTSIVGCGDLVAPYDCTLASGSLVSMNANGTFTFRPSPTIATGAPTDDTFQYVITDQPAAGTPLTATGTVTIHVFDKVWYVKQGATGNGRSDSPLGTFTGINNAGGAGDSDVAGDYIFVQRNTATAITSNIELEANQHLLGEGVQLSIPRSLNGGPNPTVLVAAGTKPTVTSAVNTVSIVNAVPVEIRGLSLASTGGGGNAVDMSSNGALTGSGTLTISSNTVTGATAEGIDINLAAGTTGTLSLAVSANDVTSTGTGIDISRNAGTLQVTAFNDNVVSGNTAGAGISVVGTGATVLFDTNPGTAAFDVVSGGATVIGASGNNVTGNGLVLNNVRGDLSFTDLDVFSDVTAFFLVGTTPNYTGTSGTRVTANTNTPVLFANGGAAADVTDANINLVLNIMTSNNSAANGVNLTRVSGTFNAPSGSSITNATGADFNIDGGSNANANVAVTYPGTISDDVGRLVNITNVTAASTHLFSGAITDNFDGDGAETGISLTGNTGATMTFSGGVSIRTANNAAFTATGGGTLNVCDENPCNPGATGGNVNRLTTTTGTALNVTSTNIGTNNLEFQSISSNGAASGINLSTTGSSGSLVVKGNGGSCTSVTCTGGAIQNSTSHAVLFSSTLHPQFTRIAIQNSSGSGIEGTGVTNFTLQNSFIDNSGTGGAADDSNVAFNDQAAGTENNLSGTVTITNNTLTIGRWHGIMIQNFNGTIADAIVTGNIITSSTALANSLGSGINFQILGSATTVAHLTKATITGNTITNFPSGAGIQVQGGNGAAAGPAGTLGVFNNATNIVTITGNFIRGASAANRMNVSTVLYSASGKGQGNTTVSNNGSGANPLAHTTGTTIGIGANGLTTLSSTSNTNIIESNHPNNGGTGISGGSGITFGVTDTASQSWTINNNVMDNTDGNGILAVARGNNGTLNVTIRNNDAEAPLNGNRPGIRVDAGNGAVGEVVTVCADIAANTSAGSGVSAGMGIRKDALSTFGIEGLAPSPATGPQAELFIEGLNPAGNGVDNISTSGGDGTNYTNCNNAP